VLSAEALQRRVEGIDRFARRPGAAKQKQSAPGDWYAGAAISEATWSQCLADNLSAAVIDFLNPWRREPSINGHGSFSCPASSRDVGLRPVIQGSDRQTTNMPILMVMMTTAPFPIQSAPVQSPVSVCAGHHLGTRGEEEGRQGVGKVSAWCYTASWRGCPRYRVANESICKRLKREVR
jgi:hypothetical protein